MASPTLGLGEGSAESEETIGEYAAHEAQMQEAVADVFSRTNTYGVHATAKRIMDQLDELCHDEVRCPFGTSLVFKASLSFLLFSAACAMVIVGNSQFHGFASPVCRT